MLRSRLLSAALVATLRRLGRIFPIGSARSVAVQTPGEPVDGAAANSLLDSTASGRQLIAQLIEREVDAALRRAQPALADDPSAVTQDLKMMLHQLWRRRNCPRSNVPACGGGSKRRCAKVSGAKPISTATTRTPADRAAALERAGSPVASTTGSSG